MEVYEEAHKMLGTSEDDSLSTVHDRYQLLMKTLYDIVTKEKKEAQTEGSNSSETTKTLIE